MTKTLTFWKDRGHPELRGRTVDIFKISWIDGDWVRDEDGPVWGMYKPDTEEVRHLNRPPEGLGTIDVLFTDTPEELGKVVNLEAEDLSVTPEAGDLGEEKE